MRLRIARQSLTVRSARMWTDGFLKMPTCAVLVCKNNSGKNNITKTGISYHRFPKKPDIKEKWIDAAGRNNWFPTTHSTICSIHFAENCFEPIKKQRRLFPWAVPTLKLRYVLVSSVHERGSWRRVREGQTAMFTLAEMKDTVRVSPDHFQHNLTDSIAHQLNRKLANKVVLNVGLCIALYDITYIGHSYIFPGDGASHTDVKFRYIVFRPVVEEILIGKIRSCSREGVHVTLGFFDDVLIPVNALQHPSRFDETDQAWVWEYPVADGEKHDLFMDSGETIRFRVTSETFEESLPTGPPGSECVMQPVAPYRLQGGINESGLGLLTWWEGMGNTGGSEQEDNHTDDENVGS